MNSYDNEFVNPSVDAQKMIEDHKINQMILHLNQINEQVAELKEIKEKLELRLSEKLQHPEEGRKTYVRGKYAVTVTSGWNYKLDKKEYEIMKSHIKPEFNPVRERITYYVSAPEYRKVEQYGSRHDIEMIAKLMPKEPAKIRVSIELAANSRKKIETTEIED